MPTRLSVFCDRLIEAGWLAAAVLMPAFFNVFSSRVFEPDKLTMLRAVVLVMAVAWVVKTAETWSGLNDFRSSLKAWVRGTPLSPFVLVFALLYLVSTAISVAPATSFWGSYQRMQGTLVTLCYLALFFMVANGLRTRAQLERLFTTIIVTSVPIALYGIVQHAGRDPLPWGGDVISRVTSSLGNPIFLGAYLIMALPLVIYRAWWAGREYLLAQGLPERARDSAAWRAALLFALYCAIFGLEGLALLYTKSRGPWLGFVAGLAVLLGLVLWRRGYRTQLAVAAAIFAGFVAFVGVLNIHNSPLAPLKSQSPYFERIGSIADIDEGTNAVRYLIWFGDNSADPPKRCDADGSAESRGSGALGLITASPFRLLFGYGPETMYVAYNPYYPPCLASFEMRNASPDRSHNDVLDWIVTMGLAGLAAWMAILVVFFRNGYRLLRRVEDPVVQVAIAALIAAVVAHLVEILVGIAIASTRTHFWLYLGAMMALLSVFRKPAAEAMPVAAAVEKEERELVGAGVGAGRGKKARIAARRVAPGRPIAAGRGEAVLRTGVTQLGVWPVVGFGVATVLAAFPGLQSAGRWEPPATMVTVFGWVLVGMVLATLSIDRTERPRIAWRVDRLWLYVPLIAIAAYLLVATVLSVVTADIYFKRGQSYDNAKAYDRSVVAYLDAINWASDQDFYYLFLGRSLLELAKPAPDRPSPTPVRSFDEVRQLTGQRLTSLGREGLFTASLLTLEQARSLNPLNTDNSANLARLYRFWAEAVPDAGRKAELFGKSAEWYDRATTLSPHTAHLWDEWGFIYRLQGKLDDALVKYQGALALDKLYPVTYAYLGEAYVMQNRPEEALPMYEQAVKLEPSNPGLRSALGYLYNQAGRKAESLQQYEKAVELAPKDAVARQNLAVMLRDSGQFDRALREARAAIQSLPPDQGQMRERLQAFVDELVRAGAK